MMGNFPMGRGFFRLRGLWRGERLGPGAGCPAPLPGRRTGQGSRLEGRFLLLFGMQFLCWGCTPLFFFSVRGEKEERRARWRRKRGLLGADLGVAVFLPLLRGWLECCAKSAETLVHCSSGRAPRWCGDWEVCGTERVFCCGSFASMCKDALWKGCFAVLLFALLLAQCAGAGLGRRCAGGCVSFCCAPVVWVCGDALRFGCGYGCCFSGL